MKRIQRIATSLVPILALVALMLVVFTTTPQESMARAKKGFLGHQKKKGCTKCHEDQYKSWLKTGHAKAMDSLKPGEETEKKLEANLDPKKDYRKDRVCLKCHTTGFAKGGFLPDNKRRLKKFGGVGCESCHGSGKGYMQVKKKYEKDDFPRKELIEAGMLYGEEKVCRSCHNKDSPTKPEKKLDYKKVLKESTHEHFKQKVHPPRKGSEWLYKS